jgi:hypothetical protein
MNIIEPVGDGVGVPSTKLELFAALLAFGINQGRRPCGIFDKGL